jgi:protein-tyrosine phosphatase
MMPLLEVPLGLSGKVYCSPMPFSSFDPERNLFSQYLQKGISTVVLLVDDADCVTKAGKDLRHFYQAQGLGVIHLPIPDFRIPAQGALREAVLQAIEKAERGENIVVHCHAGLGRTGMFIACMAKQVLGLSGNEAIAWIRQRVTPKAVETVDQEHIVSEF